MYSEEHEDPLYTKLSKILELTSLIFGKFNIWQITNRNCQVESMLTGNTIKKPNGKESCYDPS